MSCSPNCPACRVERRIAEERAAEEAARSTYGNGAAMNTDWDDDE